MKKPKAGKKKMCKHFWLNKMWRAIKQQDGSTVFLHEGGLYCAKCLEDYENP